MLPPEIIGTTPTQPGIPATPPSAPRVADAWLWPIRKRVTTTVFCDKNYHAGVYGAEVQGFWHTGIDLNVGGTSGNGDAGMPVFACANGRVEYVAYRTAGGTWGPMVVLSHKLPNGQTVWTRYAHLGNVRPKLGDLVTKGQQIAEIGLPTKWGAKFPAHLHFDVLTRRPPPVGNLTHWPKRGGPITEVTSSYTDPTAFLNARKAGEP